MATAPPEIQTELALAEAFIASRREPEKVAALLARVEPLLARVAAEDERACLYARWIDQRAFELNRADPPKPSDAEALYHLIPVEGSPPFARCRRANGLAYARWKQGFTEEGAAFAREACRHAGDGGHLRMRAMALALLGRMLGTVEGQKATRRAKEIGRALDDEMLRARFGRRGQPDLSGSTAK